MARLSDQELIVLRRQLAQPMAPTTMQAIVDRLSQNMGHLALVQPSPFRDAFIAAQFALLRGATTVHLGDNPPDFHVSGISGCTTFEAVETFPEGRRRSDEYRQLAEATAKRLALGADALNDAEGNLFKATSDPDDDGSWEARAGTAGALLSTAVAKKSSKNYPTQWGLVVLLDLGGFVHNDRAVVAQMLEGTALARHRFAEVWVLWHHVAWHIWCAGEPRMRKVRI